MGLQVVLLGLYIINGCVSQTAPSTPTINYTEKVNGNEVNYLPETLDSTRAFVDVDNNEITNEFDYPKDIETTSLLLNNIRAKALPSSTLTGIEVATSTVSAGTSGESIFASQARPATRVLNRNEQDQSKDASTSNERSSPFEGGLSPDSLQVEDITDASTSFFRDSEVLNSMTTTYKSILDDKDLHINAIRFPKCCNSSEIAQEHSGPDPKCVPTKEIRSATPIIYKAGTLKPISKSDHITLSQQQRVSCDSTAHFAEHYILETGEVFVKEKNWTLDMNQYCWDIIKTRSGVLKPGIFICDVVEVRKCCGKLQVFDIDASECVKDNEVLRIPSIVQGTDFFGEETKKSWVIREQRLPKSCLPAQIYPDDVMVLMENGSLWLPASEQRVLQPEEYCLVDIVGTGVNATRTKIRGGAFCTTEPAYIWKRCGKLETHWNGDIDHCRGRNGTAMSKRMQSLYTDNVLTIKYGAPPCEPIKISTIFKFDIDDQGNLRYHCLPPDVVFSSSWYSVEDQVQKDYKSETTELNFNVFLCISLDYYEYYFIYGEGCAKHSYSNCGCNSLPGNITTATTIDNTTATNTTDVIDMEYEDYPEKYPEYDQYYREPAEYTDPCTSNVTCVSSFTKCCSTYQIFSITGTKCVEGKPKKIHRLFQGHSANQTWEELLSKAFILSYYNENMTDLYQNGYQMAIMDNGSLRVSYRSPTLCPRLRSLVYSPWEYCIDDVLEIQDGKPVQRPAYIVWSKVFVTTNNDDRITRIGRLYVYPVCMSLSCIFLVLAIAFYSCVPSIMGKDKLSRKKKPQISEAIGKLQVGLMSCMLLGFLTLLAHHFISLTDHQYAVCVVVAILKQFLFLSVFFWLNAVVIKIWTLFGGSDLKQMRKEKSGIIMYEAYCFGGPLVICGLTVLFNFYGDWLPCNFHPRINFPRCYFQDAYAMALYYYIPVACLVAVNLVLFIHIIRNLSNRHVTTRNSSNREDGMRVSTLKQRDEEQCWMNVRLFFVTGVSWILEAVAWFTPPAVAVVCNSISSLQGVFYFIALIGKKNRINDIKSLFRPRTNSVYSTTTRSTTISGAHSGANISNLNGSSTASLTTVTTSGRNSVDSGIVIFNPQAVSDHQRQKFYRENRSISQITSEPLDGPFSTSFSGPKDTSAKEETNTATSTTRKESPPSITEREQKESQSSKATERKRRISFSELKGKPEQSDEVNSRVKINFDHSNTAEENRKETSSCNRETQKPVIQTQSNNSEGADEACKLTKKENLAGAADISHDPGPEDISPDPGPDDISPDSGPADTSPKPDTADISSEPSSISSESTNVSENPASIGTELVTFSEDNVDSTPNLASTPSDITDQVSLESENKNIPPAVSEEQQITTVCHDADDLSDIIITKL